MGSSIPLRDDYCAGDLRRIAKGCSDNRQIRRLLALAAVYDGVNRTQAARMGGMDRQTLRDWVHRFNQLGPDGLMNAKGAGRPRFLNDDQMQELARIVEAGPDLKADGVVRWRRIDLVRKIKALFGIRPV
jgi:transposase